MADSLVVPVLQSKSAVFDSLVYTTHYQHGFRRKRSCKSQLLITTTDLFRTMESEGITDAVVLDFSKTFDKVPQEFLMQKLNHIDVHGNQR